MNRVRQTNLLDNCVLTGNNLYPVMRTSSLELTPIVVPAGHPARELIDIAHYHARDGWMGWMGFFDRHFSGFGQFWMC
jgi:hypothetical protein